MNQRLFYTDEYEALGLMISHSRREFKEVASFLFPHLKPESAYARLKKCLNSESDERLSFGQIIAAMKFCDQYDPLYYACDETVHDRPQKRAIEDQEDEMVRVIEKASETMEKALSQLEVIRQRKVVRAVK